MLALGLLAGYAGDTVVIAGQRKALAIGQLRNLARVQTPLDQYSRILERREMAA